MQKFGETTTGDGLQSGETGPRINLGCARRRFLEVEARSGKGMNREVTVRIWDDIHFKCYG